MKSLALASALALVGAAAPAHAVTIINGIIPAGGEFIDLSFDGLQAGKSYRLSITYGAQANFLGGAAHLAYTFFYTNKIVTYTSEDQFEVYFSPTDVTQTRNCTVNANGTGCAPFQFQKTGRQITAVFDIPGPASSPGDCDASSPDEADCNLYYGNGYFWMGPEFSAVASTPFRASLQAIGGVPEPATWALMILGFGITGGGLRKRTRSTAQGRTLNFLT